MTTVTEFMMKDDHENWSTGKGKRKEETERDTIIGIIGERSWREHEEKRSK